VSVTAIETELNDIFLRPAVRARSNDNTSDMSVDREQESMAPLATTSWAAMERENRELRAVNRILVGKVVELEDEILELKAELKKARGADPKVHQ
jgi:hypothetical protein